MNPRRPLRLCLAGSGGGHVRQLLDLKPVWSAHDYFFVTEDTALGKSLSDEHRTYFVAHYAAGQARLGAPFKMIWNAIRNALHSARIVARERPDVVISTGAGAVFFTVLWARLAGARIVSIDSFARFSAPSLFARLVAPISHEMVVQSAKLSARLPRAQVFDPLKILESARPPKKPLLFATVGATLPFDRLVATVAQAKARGAVPEDVLIQTGEGGLRPSGLRTTETLPFNEVQQILTEADIVVCHGGTGSLITALKQGCRVIAMPRQAKLGEHYDDHQLEITEAFAARGLIEVAHDLEGLEAALERVRAREPVLATTAPDALIAFLNHFLAEGAGGAESSKSAA
jgi:UDP-N-acetylglucosamine--N-acetylmuramyl-(pentapeptide) pyrophosphoryl-undecaprenol N-acetylglucosamine transferase